jgi:hypothetical protein
MDKYAGSKCYNNNLYNAFGGESVSMSKHYHNIDVFYECVHTGTRIKDTQQLVVRCIALIEQYKRDSLIATPDYGGLLCVLGYNDNKLQSNMSYRMSWLLKCKEYINACNNDNPHNVRWHISLYYVMVKLHRISHIIKSV